MKRGNYNLNDAINLRGLTLEEAGIFGITCNTQLDGKLKITFKMSIQITSNEAPNFYDWGNLPLPYAVLAGIGGMNWNFARKMTTKDIWKNTYRSYRKYYRVENIPEDPMDEYLPNLDCPKYKLKPNQQNGY